MNSLSQTIKTLSLVGLQIAIGTSVSVIMQGVFHSDNAPLEHADSNSISDPSARKRRFKSLFRSLAQVSSSYLAAQEIYYFLTGSPEGDVFILMHCALNQPEIWGNFNRTVKDLISEGILMLK